MYKESTNVVVKHLVNRLRDTRTASNEFRLTIEEIARIIASEALNDFPTVTQNINTWQGHLDVQMIEVQKLVLVPILRAGEPMLTGILKTLPYARSGFLAMKRDEETSLSKLYYENIPNVENKTVLLLWHDTCFSTIIDLLAYMTEIFRSGIQAISVGQWEAADALGLTRLRTFQKVIMPQAMRSIVPPTGNQFIAMLKDSSLVSVVGVWDIMFIARTQGRSDFRILEMLITVSVIYWLLSMVLEYLQHKIETHYSRSLKR